MTLKEITKGMKMLNSSVDMNASITGVDYDSRRVSNGDVFVAIKGLEFDGHGFIPSAVENGASVVVMEKDPDNGFPYIKVENTRDSLALLSNNFYGRPSEKLNVIGITGTNGKTTTSYIIKSILEQCGYKSGLIGTINYIVGDIKYPAPHTTPEAKEFQGLLKEMLDKGCDCIVAEVSSHALSQKRVDYTRFACAVFTNLTRDHLDYHKTMDEYFKAKKRLFIELLADGGVAVINKDDSYGRLLINELSERKDIQVISFGIDNKNAMLKASDITVKFGGVVFGLEYNGVFHEIESPLTGLPNVYNILSAIGVCIGMGIDMKHIENAIRNAEPVNGRFESVQAGQDFLAIVDYAHTDDALERLIQTARQLTDGRVITVFGCGGERDKGKRLLMGKTATELSDIVIITSDNPRREDPDKIIKDILAGCVKDNFLVLPDRMTAINKAVSEARKEDIVLIAGKGHEDYQEINGARHKFSDKSALENAIGERLKRNN